MSFFVRRAPATKSDLQLIHRADSEPLVNCCRHLSARISHNEGSQSPLQRKLTHATTEFERVLADPLIWPAIRDGAQPWPVAAPKLLDLLLAAAGAALPTEPSLTGLIADTVLLARRGSRAAWRLRAQAHEQWGDLRSAITAHEEYLTLIDAGADKLGVAAHLRDLRELQESRVELAAALSEAVELDLRMPAQSFGELLALVSRPTREEVLAPVLEEFLADLALMPMPDLIAGQDVVHAAVRCRRTAALRPGPLPEADIRQLSVMRLGDVRGWLAGKTICLVSGAKPGIGALIDSYDLVTRFAPFEIDPETTGERTDLLVTRHDEPSGWDHQTQLRFILAEDPRDWVRSVRRKIVPGAQRALLDKALRRPAHQPALIGDDVRPGRPSSQFQVLRLLDHLDVSARIDLIGFGLDSFGDVERAWLERRLSGVRQIDEQRIGLR